ncbi:hypothetical protein E3N88_46091 [Mikania micrantha]|uniref:F-ATPase protein 6 n=1 Tax=Mikania micrantha TaxID=192012 RepID=A0A5N6L788_9ASTR|nr:hypothetical protein E3N88_46091 [Mikania micrantha]
MNTSNNNRIPQEILPGLPVQGNEDRIIQLTVSQSTVCIPGEITDPTTLANLTQFNTLMISMKHDFLNSITPPGYIESLQRELNNTPAELLAGKLESMYQYELTSLSNYYQSFGYSDQHYLNYLDFCNERYHSVVPNPVETFIPSPLEQFSILPLIPMKIGNLYLSFTNSSLFMLLTLSLVLLLIHFVTKKGGGNLVPNAWQSLVELIYDFVLNLASGGRTRRILLGKDRLEWIASRGAAQSAAAGMDHRIRCDLSRLHHHAQNREAKKEGKLRWREARIDSVSGAVTIVCEGPKEKVVACVFLESGLASSSEGTLPTHGKQAPVAVRPELSRQESSETETSGIIVVNGHESSGEYYSKRDSSKGSKPVTADADGTEWRSLSGEPSADRTYCYEGKQPQWSRASKCVVCFQALISESSFLISGTSRLRRWGISDLPIVDLVENEQMTFLYLDVLVRAGVTWKRKRKDEVNGPSPDATPVQGGEERSSSTERRGIAFSRVLPHQSSLSTWSTINTFASDQIFISSGFGSRKGVYPGREMYPRRVKLLAREGLGTPIDSTREGCPGEGIPIDSTREGCLKHSDRFNKSRQGCIQHAEVLDFANLENHPPLFDEEANLPFQSRTLRLAGADRMPMLTNGPLRKEINRS